MEDSIHESVLLREVVEGLSLKPGAILVDGTFGGGGHSFEICRSVPRARIIAIDQDEDALKRAERRFKEIDCDIKFFHGNFRDLGEALKRYGIEELDAVLLDLGLSSDQLENSGRGFSFMRDEPLLMTFKAHPKEKDLTAEDIVNDWNENNIATILKGYGEEGFANRIARAITEERQKKRIKTTFDLVRIIESAVPGGYKRGRIHFATKTFQALRMAVNDELQGLDLGLKNGFEYLKTGGRMVVISFHSLEDRIVKNFYKAKAKENEAKIISKKPIRASEDEIEINRRSRSAKLRILEKTV